MSNDKGPIRCASQWSLRFHRLSSPQQSNSLGMCWFSNMLSRQAGSTLLEATLAVALLGTLVLSVVPVVHSSRAASRHARAGIETAVLAEYLASAARSGSIKGDVRSASIDLEGVFDPPLDEYSWTIRLRDHDGQSGTSAITVYSRYATSTVVAQ